MMGGNITKPSLHITWLEAVKALVLSVWKKAVCGDPDYIISWSSSEIKGESSISKNYYYGKDQDWTTEYKYVTTNYYDNNYKTYFNCHLQGWD